MRLILLVFLIFYSLTASADPSQSVGYPPSLFRIHSHNDYEHSPPLFYALGLGIRSVEADVWYIDPNDQILFDGNERRTSHLDFYISHFGWSLDGTLENLYLKPLLKLVQKNKGSVFGDGKTFYLWIEFKQDDAIYAEILHEVLVKYASILSHGGPVEVILTGYDAPKITYVHKYHDLAVTRDANSLAKQHVHRNHCLPPNGDEPPHPDFPQADSMRGWSWYALSWLDLFTWNGKGRMPEDQRKKLKDTVQTVHARGRLLRFYDMPETRSTWIECLMAGVDLIGADDLQKIHDFMVEPLTVGK